MSAGGRTRNRLLAHWSLRSAQAPMPRGGSRFRTRTNSAFANQAADASNRREGYLARVSFNAAPAMFCTIIAALALASCRTAPTPEPIVRTVEVRVPVAVACVPTLSAKPTYPDTDAALKAAPDIFEAVRLLLAGRELRRPRESELEAALLGCATAAPAP